MSKPKSTKSPRIQRPRGNRPAPKLAPTITLSPDLHHFLWFVSEEFKCDFQTAMNTVLGVGMHHVVARFTADRQLDLLRLCGEIKTNKSPQGSAETCLGLRRHTLTAEERAGLTSGPAALVILRVSDLRCRQNEVV